MTKHKQVSTMSAMIHIDEIEALLAFAKQHGDRVLIHLASDGIGTSYLVESPISGVQANITSIDHW